MDSTVVEDPTTVAGKGEAEKAGGHEGLPIADEIRSLGCLARAHERGPSGPPRRAHDHGARGPMLV